MPDFKNIGRYIVEHLLGEGAMGSVFRAKDPFIKRTVAIKIVKLDASANEEEVGEFLKRFQLEAQISGHLNHPNIVSIYDVGEQDGMPYIAMEYVEGMTLSKYVRQENPPSSATRMKVLAQLAGALDFAHAKGIVHRDLKPANVLVKANGEPKIMDFGIAKMSGSNLTQTGVFLGTPSYSSPEQIKEGQVDFRSDIFSLGTLAHEALTEKLPFPGQSINAILYKIANDPPTIATDVDGIRPSVFREVMSRALDKNPDKRYQTASEFTTALLRCLELSKEEATMVGTVMGRMDETVREAITVGKNLERSEFEQSRLESVQPAPEKKKKKKGFPVGLLVTAILIALIGGGGFYLHREGRLTPMIDELMATFEGEAQTAVAETPEPIVNPVAEPPPETAVLERSFSVSSVPPGASVYLNEDSIGVTPLSYTWRAPRDTTAELEVRAEGHASTSQEIRLTEDMNPNYNFTLEVLPVQRTIVSKPAGATVTIDGSRAGKTPLERALIPGKTYRIALSLQGYEPRSIRYTEGSSRSSALTMTLAEKPPPGTLRVNTLFDDLKVTVDGKSVRGTSLQLEAGAYQIGLRADSVFYSDSRQMTLKAGETTAITTPVAVTVPKLEVIGGFFNVKINGRFVTKNKEKDLTPLLNLRLVTGRHTIELVDSETGNTVKTETVEVTKGDDITLSVSD